AVVRGFQLVDECYVRAVRLSLFGHAAPGEHDVVGCEGATGDRGEVVEFEAGPEGDRPDGTIGVRLRLFGEVAHGAKVGLGHAGAGVVLKEPAIGVGRHTLRGEGGGAVRVDGGRVAGCIELVDAAALGVGVRVGCGRRSRRGFGRGCGGRAVATGRRVCCGWLVVVVIAATDEGEAGCASAKGCGTAEEATPASARRPIAVPVLSCHEFPLQFLLGLPGTTTPAVDRIALSRLYTAI